MTPLQKRRHSVSRQGKRRSTIKISLPKLQACSNCHQPTPTHAACRHCGFYKGRKVS